MLFRSIETAAPALRRNLMPEIEEYGVEPVPTELRTAGWRTLFAINFTFFLNPVMYVLGALAVVDGGLPLDLPEGLSPDEVIQLVLGPTADRLAMRFGSVDAYLDFWRAHPAFRRDWSPALEAYLEYDLVGEEPELRPSTSYATLEEDSLDQNTGTAILDALANLRHTTVLLTAERGLLDQLPPLYADDRLPKLLDAYPGLDHVAVPDVNHYTIVLSERGADAVAAVVQEQLAYTTQD